MMAVSAWLVWKELKPGQSKRALWVFGIQLVLNTLWSLLFFGLQQPGWAFLEIIMLWMAIVATLALFWRPSRIAALLLVPYLMWVSFASVLNGTIWSLN